MSQLIFQKKSDLVSGARVTLRVGAVRRSGVVRSVIPALDLACVRWDDGQECVVHITDVIAYPAQESAA